jgi:predicted RNA-binding protein YlxR (DUF448 family)
MAGGGGRPKHVPIRTCVACRQTSVKRALVRLVRDPAGVVDIDPTGKRNGRGAYLCPGRQCWELALRRGALARALKTTLRPEDRERLLQYSATLPETAPER